MQKKKILILTFVCLFSLVYADNDFTDINNHWAEKYIRDLSSIGLIKGYTDNTFKPNKEILNVEVYSIINNLINQDRSSDVNVRKEYKDRWYYKELEKAQGAGYVNIDENFTVHPITRIEMIDVISKVYNIYNDNFDNIDEMPDCFDLSKDEKDSIKKLIKNRIINGYENNTFRPFSNLTRAEFSKIVDLSNERLKLNSKYSGKIIVNNFVKIDESKKVLETLIKKVEDGNLNEDLSYKMIKIKGSLEKGKEVLNRESDINEINSAIDNINHAIEESKLKNLTFIIKDDNGDEISDYDIYLNGSKVKNKLMVKPGKYFAKIEAKDMQGYETYIIVENDNKTVEIEMDRLNDELLKLNLSEGLSAEKDRFNKNERVTVNINIPKGKEIKEFIVNGKQRNLISDSEYIFFITEDTDIKVIFQ